MPTPASGWHFPIGTDEADFTHGLHRRRIYARIAAVVFFVVTALFYFYAITLRDHIPGTDIIHVPGCLIWARAPGMIGLKGPGRAPKIVLTLSRTLGYIGTDSSDDEWSQPPTNLFVWFAIWHDRLVYWVPQDRTLCLLSQHGPKRWLRVNSPLLDAATVYEVRPAPDGVDLNLADAHGRCGSLNVDLLNGNVSQIPFAIAVKSNEMSPDYAELTQNGRIYVCKDGQNHLLLNYASEIYTWDSDPTAGVVAFLRSYDSSADNILYIRGSHNVDVQLGSYYHPRDIWLDPRQRSIWVCVLSDDKVFRTLLYDYTGKFVGEGPAADRISEAPIYTIDEPLANAISHLPADH